MSLVKKPTLLKTGEVARRMGVTAKCIENWANDLEDDFPKPTIRKGRNYWVESEIDEYIQKLIEVRDKQYDNVTSIFERRAG